MHGIKGGWAGQAFVVAASNDAGGKKTRIRRSKEERKAMVETFIKTYQKSNNASFPSLNLTHKEVGGSFYTVREVVREIIQENRVLAPPKVSVEERDSSGYLEQHPLGSISIEPQTNSSVSDGLHSVVHVYPHQISSQENISTSSVQLENEHIINGLSKRPAEEDESDKPTKDVPVHHQEKDDGTLVSSPKLNPGGQKLYDEQYPNENGQMLDKNKESGQRIHAEPVVMEILDTEEGPKDMEISQAVISNVKSDVVIETFPLRPISETIQNMDVDSGKPQDAAGAVGDKEILHNKMTFFQEKDEKRLPDSTVEVNGKYRDEKSEINVLDPSLETSKLSTASEIAGSSPTCLVSEDSTAARRKSRDQDSSSSCKENNPVLDRISLETWEGVSKKSTQPQTNPFMALVKTFISSFVKFWTE